MASDEELAGQVARGDEEALRELLRRYERPLSSFIYRHTGGQDVEDLFQETWLRVVRQAQRFDPSLRFSTWLFQIAVNLCRDAYRRRQAAAGLPDHEPESATLQSAEARADTTHLLAQLPELLREVVVLRYFHDLSEKEAAEILGCPVGTVKSRLHNALQRLAALTAKDNL